MIALRAWIVVAAFVAGLAEAQGWGKTIWSLALLAVVLGAVAELAVDLYRARPSNRVGRVLARIAEYVLQDRGTYTFTIYRRSKDGRYRPFYRYARQHGFLCARRFRWFRGNLDTKPAFPPGMVQTTIGAALSDIGQFYSFESIPEFKDREEMIRYHSNDRHLPTEVVSQFSDRAVHIRSVGSVAIPYPKCFDVAGVLTIDCTDPEAFIRHKDNKHSIEQLLSYWVARLSQVLP